MSWKHQSPRNAMEDYWISIRYCQCSGTSQYKWVGWTCQQRQQNHSVFRLLVMIDPIGQHSCVGFFLSFTSLNPFFLLCNYYYYYATWYTHIAFTAACFFCWYWHMYPCMWHFHHVIFALISGPLWNFEFHLLLLHLSPFFMSYSFHLILWSLFLCMVCCHRLHIYRAACVYTVIFFPQGS